MTGKVPKEILTPCIIWVLSRANRELTVEGITERVQKMTTDEINEAREIESSNAQG